MVISRSRMRTPKACLAVNTGCSESVDDSIYVPVTFVAGSNLRNAILWLQY
jgi:hypothetical protein